MTLIRALDHVLRTPDGSVLQQGISFDLKHGDRVGITGPSGCGKSTFLREIAGRVANQAGCGDTLEVAVGDADFLPQWDFMFPWFSPKQNMNAWLGRKLGHVIGETDLARAAVLGIDEVLDRRFSDLSGGERQRVALWTALARENDLLIIDEPFTALDIERKLTCLEVLSTAIGDTLKSLIFVSHDYDVLTYLANRILLFDASPTGTITIFEYPEPPPVNRGAYLERRMNNSYDGLLQALTGNQAP